MWSLNRELPLKTSSTSPVNYVPQFETVVPVVEVGDKLKPSVGDVVWWAEGAVGHLRERSPHQLYDPIVSK